MERIDDSERIKRQHFDFLERWAPDDPRERSYFEAQLCAMMADVWRDAQKPFVEAAASHLAMLPMAPVFMPKDE